MCVTLTTTTETRGQILMPVTPPPCDVLIKITYKLMSNWIDKEIVPAKHFFVKLGEKKCEPLFYRTDYDELKADDQIKHLLPFFKCDFRFNSVFSC
jgi:hypothetical protein